MTSTPLFDINGTGLHVSVHGSSGPPVVLVHGSWVDSRNWSAVAGSLASSGYTVLAYDRGGHGLSETPSVAPTRRDHEDDLAGLIETLFGGEPAHLVGSSFGGLIALGLAARSPSLVASVSVHEPPAASVAPSVAASAVAVARSVAGQVHDGDAEAAARRFFEQVVLGPGAWDAMPSLIRSAAVRNAATFLAEQSDPEWPHLDIPALRRFAGPLLVTRGSRSLPWLQQVAEQLSLRLSDQPAAWIRGAGHAPHLSHPGPYAALLRYHLDGSVAEPELRAA